MLRGERSAVLHLHGYFRDAKSVVFDAKSYRTICDDEGIRESLRSMLLRDHVVFIGCGDGMDDPNFAALFDWSRPILEKCRSAHFHLLRSKDVPAAFERYKGLGITPVSYGAEYSDLPSFLERVAQHIKTHRVAADVGLDLVRAQADYYSELLKLKSIRSELVGSAFVAELFQKARRLWEAGGHRAAVMQMDAALSAEAESLVESEQLDYGLELVDRLLTVGYDSLAGSRLHRLEPVVARQPRESAYHARFLGLAGRLLAARADSTQGLQIIDQRLADATEDTRPSLEAERAELRFLHGQLD